MSWPIGRIRNWDHFSGIVGFSTPMGSPTHPMYLFRGQANEDWSLKPSLARVLGSVTSEYAMFCEKEGIKAFLAQAHLYFSSHLVQRGMDLQYLGDWALMQHYWAPTRLLDWTASPYVAAYFAVESNLKEDGAVWMFHREPVIKHFTDEGLAPGGKIADQEKLFMDPQGKPQILLFSRTQNTERMVAQQGSFSVGTQPLTDQADLLAEIFKGSPPGSYVKLIIPKELKLEFLHRLRYMNISANSLFPGIDGIGRSVAELYRLSKPRSTPPATESGPSNDFTGVVNTADFIGNSEFPLDNLDGVTPAGDNGQEPETQEPGPHVEETHS